MGFLRGNTYRPKPAFSAAFEAKRRPENGKNDLI